MKKIGYFFSGFLPILTAFAAQFLASVFMAGVVVLFLCPAIPSVRRQTVNLDTLEALMTNTGFSACIMLIYSITCIVFLGLWYYRSCNGNYLPSLSRTFHPLQLLAIVILVPGMQFFSNYLTAVVALIFPDWLKQYESLMETAGLDSDIGILMLLYAVILGPMCEELIFRGVTMRIYRRIFPFWAANLMQALLFGIFHMNWIQGIYAFVLGLVLGILCEKGGSIYCSLLFHILFNFWGTIISQFLGNIKDTFALDIFLFFAMIVSLAFGAFLFRQGDRRKKAKQVLTVSADPAGDDHPGESE